MDDVVGGYGKAHSKEHCSLHCPQNLSL